MLVVPSSGDSRFSLVCSAAAALHLREQPTLDQVLQTTVSGPLACAVRQSLPYRFEHERLILGEEMLRSHGWQIGAKVPDCSGLTEAELQDLVGEMQAVQTLSVVLWSTLAIVAPRLGGLFASELE